MGTQTVSGRFGASEIANFEVIQGGRDGRKHAKVSNEVRLAIVVAICKLGHGLQRVAKRNGLGYNDVVTVLVDHAEEEGRRQYIQGYRVGLLRRGIFPGGPGRMAA